MGYDVGEMGEKAWNRCLLWNPVAEATISQTWSRGEDNIKKDITNLW